MLRKALALLLFAFPLAAAEYTKNVAIVVFDGVEVLDLAAPAEVFAMAGRFGMNGQEPAYRVYTVATTRSPIASQGFLDVVPDYAIADAPQPDILVLPGGRADRVIADAKLMQWIGGAALKADHVLTICYGAFIAGELGMLDGLDATTWYGSVERLAAEFPKTRAHSGRRFLDNGKVITTAGVSAGLDGSLHLVARDAGRLVADRTAEYMEYPWAPPSQTASTYPLFNPRLDARGRSLQQAAVAARGGDVEGAAAIYRTIVTQNAADAEAWLQLGSVLHTAKRHGEAAAAFGKAAEGTAQRPMALYNLACAYALGGETEKAIEAVRGAIEAGMRSKASWLRDPDLTSIREDGRFVALLAQL
ncbi:MAG TPA: DJ-1/PfpI family protein [Thermoanaerobaculia bacterium]|nr:DJ-1/PfpI family protein [Thermoanaerobaculia bacterium]